MLHARRFPCILMGRTFIDFFDERPQIKHKSFSRPTDYCRFGCVAGTACRGLRKRLLKPSDCQSTGASRAKPPLKLHGFFGVRSRGVMGCEFVAARRALRWHVRRTGDAVRPQTSSSFNVLAVFIVVDFNSVREVCRNDVHDGVHRRLLLCNRLDGNSGKIPFA